MAANDYRIVAARAGGPEVLATEAVADLTPGPGEARIRHRAIGVNYIDTYYRSGLYPSAMPAGLGAEAAGVVEAVGPNVANVAPGDRVAYATGGQGAYATVRVIPAEHLLPLPPELSYEMAAATMLKGMTAAYLVGPCAKVQAGQTVLVHAAAGGVGSILVQWAHALGAVVIGHVGSSSKTERVKALGADHALDCPMSALATEVERITNGHGADIVFDGVGAASWSASLGAVAKSGLLVSYGNASGAVPAITPLDLMAAGSIFLTRPTLRDYGGTQAQRAALADKLFRRIASGKIRIDITLRLPLERAAEAHRALEGRKTVGSTILTVPE